MEHWDKTSESYLPTYYIRVESTRMSSNNDYIVYKLQEKKM